MTRTLRPGLIVLLALACGPATDEPPEPLFTIGAGMALTFQGAWSPDGARYAYAEMVEGKAAIFAAGRDGSNPVRITHGVWDATPEWSPDGQWIAYYSDEDADIYVVPAAGGERRQLTSGPAQDNVAGWMPDGSAVLVERVEGGTVSTLAVPLDGTEPRVIGRVAGATTRAYPSPDGSQLVIQVEQGGSMTIWVQGLPDGEPRQLTTEGLEDPDTPTAWSPDGRFILYESRRSGTADLWIVEAATGTTRQLTTDVRDDFQGRWSPDGQWVAFLSTRGGQQDVWLVPAAGGEAVRVTNSRALEDGLTWSPDGRALSFTLADTRPAIGQVAVDGTPARTLIEWDGPFLDQAEPSPDGSRILIGGSRGGSLDLVVAPATGGEQVTLVGGPTVESSGRWSPDGSQVAFISNRGGTLDLWVVPAAGGEPRRLTDWTPAIENSPRWSPDGSHIAFLSNRDAGALELWSVPVAGGAPSRLAPGLQVQDFSWTPDGQTLVADAVAAGGNQGLYAIPSSGGTPRPLLDGDMDVGRPIMSPDGAMVAFTRFGGGWGWLEVVPLAGGTPRRLTTRAEDVYHTTPRWSPDGSMIVVEDFVLPTNGQELEVVTWPDGEWRRLPAVPNRYMSRPEWTPDSRNLIYLELDGSSRIIAVPVRFP